MEKSILMVLLIRIKCCLNIRTNLNLIVVIPFKSITFKNVGYKFLEAVYEDLGISQAVRLLKSRSKIEYDIDGI